jgi:hypothetical protein
MVFPVQCNDSVLVRDLHLGRAALRPDKADAGLIVDADAMLTRTVPAQPLESIAGWDGELIQPRDRVQLVQFAARRAPELRREPPAGYLAFQPRIESDGRRGPP